MSNSGIPPHIREALNNRERLQAELAAIDRDWKAARSSVVKQLKDAERAIEQLWHERRIELEEKLQQHRKEPLEI